MKHNIWQATFKGWEYEEVCPYDSLRDISKHTKWVKAFEQRAREFLTKFIERKNGGRYGNDRQNS